MVRFLGKLTFHVAEIWEYFMNIIEVIDISMLANETQLQFYAVSVEKLLTPFFFLNH